MRRRATPWSRISAPQHQRRGQPAWLPKDDSNPYFTYDPSKCIVCALRARLRRGAGHLRADHRRAAALTAAFMPGGRRHRLTSDCVSCGACVQACPTATLNEKSVIEIGTPDRTVITTCAYCGVGCQFKAELRGDELVRMTPYKHGKANRGHSCVKGRFAYGYATHQDRILKPMIRDRSAIRGAKCPGPRRWNSPPPR
jgi:formate dehydrogenase major subunit